MRLFLSAGRRGGVSFIISLPGTGIFIDCRPVPPPAPPLQHRNDGGMRRGEEKGTGDRAGRSEERKQRARERVVIYERAVRARGSFHTFLQSLFLPRLRGRNLSLRRSSSVHSRRASAETRGPRADAPLRGINGGAASPAAARLISRLIENAIPIHPLVSLALSENRILPTPLSNARTIQRRSTRRKARRAFNEHFPPYDCN